MEIGVMDERTRVMVRVRCSLLVLCVIRCNHSLAGQHRVVNGHSDKLVENFLPS